MLIVDSDDGLYRIPGDHWDQESVATNVHAGAAYDGFASSTPSTAPSSSEHIEARYSAEDRTAGKTPANSPFLDR